MINVLKKSNKNYCKKIICRNCAKYALGKCEPSKTKMDMLEFEPYLKCYDAEEVK